MKIVRAIKTNLLTQLFGQNKVSVYKEMGMLGHNGFDWAVRCQDNALKRGGQCENVYYDLLDSYGKIIELSNEVNEGLGIVIITEDKDGIFKHRWWHFDIINPKLKVGDIISSGYLLGVAGNTGLSTGAHLHRDLKSMGKDTYGNYYKTQPNNGYFGAIDITPYFINKFVLDYFTEMQTQLSWMAILLQKMLNFLKGRKIEIKN